MFEPRDRSSAFSAGQPSVIRRLERVSVSSRPTPQRPGDDQSAARVQCEARHPQNPECPTQLGESLELRRASGCAILRRGILPSSGSTGDQRGGLASRLSHRRTQTCRISTGAEPMSPGSTAERWSRNGRRRPVGRPRHALADLGHRSPDAQLEEPYAGRGASIDE